MTECNHSWRAIPNTNDYECDSCGDRKLDSGALVSEWADDLPRIEGLPRGEQIKLTPQRWESVSRCDDIEPHDPHGDCDGLALVAGDALLDHIVNGPDDPRPPHLIGGHGLMATRKDALRAYRAARDEGGTARPCSTCGGSLSGPGAPFPRCISCGCWEDECTCTPRTEQEARCSNDDAAPRMARASLTDFLLARIAEREAAARRGLAGFTDEGWHTVECGVHLGYWAETDCTCRYGEGVLADCEAKRQIVEHHAPYAGGSGRPTLQLLALPYADHPDYREEWKP